MGRHLILHTHTGIEWLQETSSSQTPAVPLENWLQAEGVGGKGREERMGRILAAILESQQHKLSTNYFLLLLLTKIIVAIVTEGVGGEAGRRGWKGQDFLKSPKNTIF